VAAVDGVHFAMLFPGSSVRNANSFFVGRKNCCAVLYLAACDAMCRFVSFDMS
jgi:hypothetical protein